MSMFTRRTVPAEWSLERIYSLVDSVYVASDHVPNVAAVVIRVPSSLMPRKVLRAQIEIHAEPWIEQHWWGFSWHEYDMEEACLDDPIHCIRARGAQRALADTRNAARAWVSREIEDQERPLAEVPWSGGFLGTLLTLAVRTGPNSWILSAMESY